MIGCVAEAAGSRGLGAVKPALTCAVFLDETQSFVLDTPSDSDGIA